MTGSDGLGKTTLCCRPIEVIVNDCQCWSWKDNLVLCIEVIVNPWQFESWKINFELCIEVIVNDWQCQPWKDNLCCALR